MTSKITREQLEEWVAQFDEDGGCDATDRQLEALIRQSLAAMDSEPVATLDVQSRRPDGNKFALVFSSAAHKLPDDVYFLYRHAQPAPVVPDEAIWTCDPRKRGEFYTQEECNAWNACRAAMLQAGNSPVIPESCSAKFGNFQHYWHSKGYVMVPKDPTEAMCDISHIGVDVYCGITDDNEYYSIGGADAAKVWKAMIAAAPQTPGSEPSTVPGKWIPVSERMPEMGEKQRYVLAADFKNNYWPNIPNTQVGVYGDWFDDGNPTWDDGDGEDLHLKEVTHWMPLPAAPQEVE